MISHFTKSEWMANIHMKRYLTLLVTREMIIMSLGDVIIPLSIELQPRIMKTPNACEEAKDPEFFKLNSGTTRQTINFL